MDAEIRTRCSELFRALSGRKPRGNELDSLLARVSSYEEFRVHLVSSGALGAAARPLLQHWASHTEQRRLAPDSNDLLHRIEHLAAKQVELALQFEQLARGMREKFHNLDELTDRVAALNERYRQNRQLLANYRSAIARLDTPRE